jgi:hypothetical protein
LVSEFLVSRQFKKTRSTDWHTDRTDLDGSDTKEKMNLGHSGDEAGYSKDQSVPIRLIRVPVS